MSSLLALQTTDTIIFASDRALSTCYNNKTYRVSNNEIKLFDFPNFIMFASGKKKLRDRLINRIGNRPTIDVIKKVLQEDIILDSTEFSLEVVIAMKNMSKMIFFSSVDHFKYRENKPDKNNTAIFTAGYKNNEIADSFISNYASQPIIQSIENTYKVHSCDEIGGNLDIYILKKDSLVKKKIKIDDKKEYSDQEILGELLLVHAERLVGRIILGNKLWIEDSIGVVSIQSGTISIYDDKKALRVHLGRYPDPDNAGKFKYGFRAYKGAFDIRTDEGRRGVQIDENGIRAFNNNGVVTFEVIARTGEVKIAGSLSIKTHPDSNRGVVIDGDGIRGYNASGGIVFQIDNYGNAWFAGRLQSATGSVDNLDGTFKGDLVAAGGTFTGTLYGVDGVFTGSLSAVNGTFTGDLIAARGTFDGLVTGSLSTNTMRAISIDADQIVSGYIRANRLDVDELSAISANLGYVTSGTIDIDTDLSVGRNIYLGKRWASDFKSIVFSGSTQITGNWNKMTLSAMEVSLDASYIVAGNSSSYVSCYGTWDFSGARVTGLR